MKELGRLVSRTPKILLIRTLPVPDSRRSMKGSSHYQIGSNNSYQFQFEYQRLREGIPRCRRALVSDSRKEESGVVIGSDNSIDFCDVGSGDWNSANFSITVDGSSTFPSSSSRGFLGLIEST